MAMVASAIMLRHRGCMALIAGFVLSLLASRAHAWNSTGHQVIAQIAWKDLKPAVREKVAALLKQHPHYSNYLQLRDVSPDEPDYDMRVFMRAATWPDLVRNGMGKEREYNHPDWHFINLPIIAEGTDRTTLELPSLGEKLEAGKSPQNIL